LKLVLASGNPGKRRELEGMLAPLGIELVPQSALGIAEAEEPHESFRGNALAKARHASRAAGLPALADDSGICVDALGGAPGVRSARYAGEPVSDSRNNEKLLSELKNVNDRHARYVCVIALVKNPEDSDPLVAEGEWHGEIARAPRGSGGFGYDPLFWLPGRGCTAAELDPAEKNRVSHRGLALSRLLELLRKNTNYT
jgi:XTP/dITP diphosphohydrolase